MHIDVNNAGSLESDEFVFAAQQVQLAAVVNVEVVAWGAHDLHCGSVGHETLIPDLNAFTIAQSLLNEV